jgi:antitoxin MazE
MNVDGCPHAREGNCLGRLRDIHCFRVYPAKEPAMQVSKWGNSLAVRLPSSVVEVLDLKEGDEIEIEVTDARRFEVRKRPGRREVLDRLRAYRGQLPSDFKFDRLEANESIR